jgi:chromosomal replication initiation ATPase DnaA
MPGGGDDTGHYEMLKRRAAEQLERDDLSDAVKAKIKGEKPIRHPAAETKNSVVKPEERPSMAAKREPTPKDIIAAVCRAWDIPEVELLGEERGQRQSRPRDALCWMLNQTALSLPRVGKIVRRHHTSVLQAIRRAIVLYGTDAEWRNSYQVAKKIITEEANVG